MVEQAMTYGDIVEIKGKNWEKFNLGRYNQIRVSYNRNPSAWLTKTGGEIAERDWPFIKAVRLSADHPYYATAKPDSVVDTLTVHDDPVAPVRKGVNESLTIDAKPDRFANESPKRGFTDWNEQGVYAVGKGFRPSMQHLPVYLDAIERKEGWRNYQVLHAEGRDPTFLFRKIG